MTLGEICVRQVRTFAPSPYAQREFPVNRCRVHSVPVELQLMIQPYDEPTQPDEQREDVMMDARRDVVSSSPSATVIDTRVTARAKQETQMASYR